MEKYRNDIFLKDIVISKIKEFLPKQAPLKDFVFQNNLAAFQNKKFNDALRISSGIFGYKNYLPINEYRNLYYQGKINKAILNQKLENSSISINDLLFKKIDEEINYRIGNIRIHWKTKFKVDLDSLVHPILYRIICNYLDQGISIWNFPKSEKGFLESVFELEKNSKNSFFKSNRVKELIHTNNTQLENLLNILVGDESLFEQYLFDQQFAHPGWSGMVACIEHNPHTILDTRNICLEDFIRLELLFEIDALDVYFGEIWSPICHKLTKNISKIFDPIPHYEVFEALEIFQTAYEWTYYDQVLAAIKLQPEISSEIQNPSFQILFCIDDRIESIRRYIEQKDKNCQTFSTPGHFNVEFYFQPERSKFYTKVCPAPITPKYLIKEVDKKTKVKKDFHFSKTANGLMLGWLFTHSLGFWSLIKLFISVFYPIKTASFVTSSKHMDPDSILTIDSKNLEKNEDGLQIGFTIEEMTIRAYEMLAGINLTNNFSSIVYLLGHGSSSANNPFYATMDCGACSCKPGSVNARVMSSILNKKEVRKKLTEKGIEIPENTQFIGGLHDTARDEFYFFDQEILNEENRKKHDQNKRLFNEALALNAKERSRKFASINTKKSPNKILKEVKTRTISLFEPRPELDHATASMCVIGRRAITKNLFLDRRAFLNSYDYSSDLNGEKLKKILGAASPVCGGINLSYYFSKVDNQNLGSGSKLPHNVMGLFGIANGTDGDLRPGLPIQMVELHDPIRLLMLVEHFPEIVIDVIKSDSSLYEWYANEWMILAVIHPFTKEIFVFKDEQFKVYEILNQSISIVNNISEIIENTSESIPACFINN